MYRYIAALLVTSLFFACKAKPKDNGMAGVHTYVFMDSDQGKDYLRQAESEGYYDFMSPAHRSIQTRDTLPPRDIAAQRAKYMDVVTSHAMSWTEEEVSIMTAVMDTARRIVKDVNPTLWPSEINMIKVDPVHYGNSVYYTIDEAIVWPANVLTTVEHSQLLTVALHEVWHLLSREHQELRDSMYALIGFYRHGYEIEMGPYLQQQLLVNPDGVTMDHAIRLSSPDGSTIEAIPLLVSRFDSYRPKVGAFFDHLHFDLHELRLQDDGRAYVESKSDGTSTMNPVYFADFFPQIRDNTQYIIHPDEIMADNFMMAVRAIDLDDMKSYSPEGQDLLELVIGLLSRFQADRKSQ